MGLNVKFGVSTWLWASPFSTSLARPLFEKISAMGYDVVEIAVEDPKLLDTRQLRQLLEEFELGALVCGAFGSDRDLTSEEDAIQKNALSYIASCLDICNELGAPFLAGPMYSAVGKARMVSPEQRKKEWDLAVENLRKVCQMAEERNLSIALEPLNRFESDLVNTAADAVRMVGDIAHPAARILLDGFHMNIEEAHIEQAIRTAGEYLIHVQVADNYRGVPGTGQVNWQAWYTGLEAIGYEGTVSIESFTPNNKELAAAVCVWKPLAESQDLFASKGLEFLRKWASGTNLMIE